MDKRPNILFIMTDHTSARALSSGSGCLTPHLDALAADGRQFNRCYTTNAICSPARASLMTGAYPSTHGIWDCTHTQPKHWVHLPPGQSPFFSSYLAEAGYRTGYFGKWHAESTNKPADFGWQEHDPASGAGLRADPARPQVIIPKDGYRDYKPAGVSTAPDPRHPAFDSGIGFLKRAAAAGAPFCCFVSAQEPHDPYIAPESFAAIKIPVLFVFGDRDVVSFEHILHMYRALPANTTQLCILPNADHFIFPSKATLLNPIIHHFFSEQ